MRVVIPLAGLGEAGGIKVLFKLADFLVEKGHDVTFIIIEGKDIYDKINIKTKANRIHIDIPPLLRIFSRWVFHAFIPAYLLYRAIPECDVVIANFWTTAYSVALSKKPKCKLYYCQAFEPSFYYHEYFYHLPIYKRILSHISYRIFRFLSAQSYRLGLKMFANNAKIVREIKSILGNKSIEIPIVPAGVDITLYNTDGRKNSGKPVVGIIVSPSFWKGSKYFFEGMVKLKERGSSPFEILCAFGPPPPGTPNVEAKWVKPKTQRELAEFYKSVDILVSPMILTGEFPLPPLEGMACGCAVISTNLIYGKSMENYYEIPPGDADAIADAVEELLADECLRKKLQRNGLELAKQFAWENIYTKFMEMLTSFTAQKQEIIY
ncbi:MAG: glycosyltransferase family 4 protein [Thermoplasmata archaeon]